MAGGATCQARIPAGSGRSFPGIFQARRSNPWKISSLRSLRCMRSRGGRFFETAIQIVNSGMVLRNCDPDCGSPARLPAGEISGGCLPGLEVSQRPLAVNSVPGVPAALPSPFPCWRGRPSAAPARDATRGTPQFPSAGISAQWRQFPSAPSLDPNNLPAAGQPGA